MGKMLQWYQANRHLIRTPEALKIVLPLASLTMKMA